MLKRTLAIIVSMVFLFAVMPIGGVYATYNSQLIDDFEAGRVGAVDTERGRYASSEASGLFVNPDASPWSAHLKVTENVGYNKSTGLEMFSGVTKKDESVYRETFVKVKDVPLTTENAVVLKYKVKINSLPTTKGSLEPIHLTQLVNPGTGSYHRHATFKVETNGKVLYYDPDKGSSVEAGSVNTGEWYTVVTQLSGSSVSGGTVNVKAYMLNEANVVVASKNESVYLNADMDLMPVYVSEIPTSNTTYTNLVIDDVSLTEYTAASTQTISLDASYCNIKDGDTEVAPTKSFALGFDHELAAGASSKVKLYKIEGAAKTEVAYTVESETFNSFVINPTTDLDGSSNYLIDISGVTGAAGETIGSSNISFATEEGDIVKLIDEFENEALVGDGKDRYNYQGSGAVMTDATPLRTNADGSNVDGYTRLEEAGWDGKALAFETGDLDTDKGDSHIYDLTTTDTYAPAKSLDGQNERFVITYRINIKDAANINSPGVLTDKNQIYSRGGSKIRIGATSASDRLSTTSNAIAFIEHYSDETYTATDGTTFNKYGEQLYIRKRGSAFSTWTPISENRWYNIIWTIDGNNQSFKFVDSETGELVWQNEETINLFTDGGSEAVYFNIFYGHRYRDTTNRYIYNAGQTVLIDDFTLYKIRPWVGKHALTAETDVPETFDKDSEITFSFNQPVAAEGNVFELYEGVLNSTGTTDNKRVYADPVVLYPDFCEQKLSYEGLSYLTDYSVDYSALKGEGGTDLGENKAASVVNITTGTSSDDIFVNSDINCDTLTNGGKISFDLYSKESTTTTLVAAFYQRGHLEKFEDVVMEKDIHLNAGPNKIEMDISKDIDADVIKIFAWDGMSALVPLMPDYKSMAPIEDNELNVLLIGSSISEDTGVYFDQILSAAGHSIDADRKINLTVRGVGGGHFYYHADNLRRELEAKLDDAVKNNNSDAIKAYVDEQNSVMEEEAEKGEDSSRRLYFNYTNGTFTSDTVLKDRLLISALTEKQYDFISLQPSANGYASDFVAYEEDLSYLTSTIRSLQPNAEIAILQTWAPWISDAQADRVSYFEKIENFVDSWATNTGSSVANITKGGKPLTIIPSGYAFSLAEKYFDWCGEKYNLDDGNYTADAKGTEERVAKCNTAPGLMRDYNHASFYGNYLTDAVLYELLTGEKAPVGTESNPAITKPTGEYNGATYFTISDSEHIERLTQLSEIAHYAVKKYIGEYVR